MITITVNSQFGNSIETVEINSVKEYNDLRRRLRTVHHSDGATVFASGKNFFEQIC